jgi:transglutaminase-like putative cysteine protease
MLRLHVHHRTTYSYSEPVKFGRHRLVLRPREGHDLRIVEMALEIEPAHEITWVRDVYGNSLALVDFTTPADRLEVVSDVTVERVEPFPERRFHEPWLVPWPVEYAAEEQVVTDAYRRFSFPDDTGTLEQWLGADPVRRSGDAEGTLLDLCSRVYSVIAYRRRVERGVQTPSDTLRAARGSCRDMATLMMDAARVLGVASRFASGYAHSPATLAGRASTHAWTECYLPDLGWRGFDPTTGKAIGMQYIATGVSQHPRGVMPVTGTFVGLRRLFRSLEVDVQTREIAPGPAGPPSIAERARN